MKKYLLFTLLLMLCACKVGEFPPGRHEVYDLGRPDCEKQPERCINGVPW